GFDVIGVDINPQPHYPFEFHQADALTFPLDGVNAVHASPPCQKYSIMRRGRWKDRKHPDLIPATRDRLIKSGLPYIIENVPGARHHLISPIMLCGTMFGLQTKHGAQLRRHRYFECSFPIGPTPACNHRQDASVIGVYGGGQHPKRRRIPATIGVYGNSGGSSKRDNLDFSCFTVKDRRDAMGIEWMTGKELSQAIPPAYTKYIGEFLKAYINETILS
ncbi:MAG: hypothetical protein ACOC6B_07090, partial [Thermodesulfobacteriota bacterium]